MGVTAVPNSIRSVSQPQIARVDTASRPKILASQIESKPLVSAVLEKSIMSARVVPVPAVAPVKSPIRMVCSVVVRDMELEL